MEEWMVGLRGGEAFELATGVLCGIIQSDDVKWIFPAEIMGKGDGAPKGNM